MNGTGRGGPRTGAARRPWLATQLFLPPAGAPPSAMVPAARIREAVLAARATAGLDALAVWAGAGEEARGAAVDACREAGVSPYLWFPVLADVPGAPFDAASLVESADGRRGHGSSGAWEGLAGGEEGFLFLCPNAAAAVDAVFERYAALLGRAGVDGVMLDRIRFPSPANGFEALLTCFCPACADRFRREEGGSLDPLRERARALLAAMPGWGPGEAAAGLRALAALPGSAGPAADGIASEGLAAEGRASEGLAGLAAFRARSIARVVARFAGHARGQGLAVGLDLFSPALAGLVGQDYRLLAPAADWLKPMTYCHAVGPAGLPLELASLARALLALAPRLAEREALAAVRKAFRLPVPAALSRLLADGLPERLVAAELEVVGGLELPPRVAVHAGLEAVSLPRFGIDITPAILGRYLRASAGRARGWVASWNLLAVPEANLRLLGAAKGRGAAA